MSYNNGPKIVTNGLVLYLDAANGRSYPGSGTTWTDISRNGKNGTLTNGPTFSSANRGSIVFDGTNDYVQCTGAMTVSSATFIVWVYRNGNQNDYTGIFFSRGTNVTGLNIVTSHQLGYHWNDTSNTAGWNSSGLVIPSLQWSLCAISVSPTFATAYLCQQSGITSVVNNVSHASTTIDDVKIGQDEATGVRWFNGRVAMAQMYNRALSASEIQQNYNATKGRFNL